MSMGRALRRAPSPEVVFWRSWKTGPGRQDVFPNLSQNVKLVRSWEKLSQSSQGGYLSKPEQFQDDPRTFPVTDVWAEARSRQMKFFHHLAMMSKQRRRPSSKSDVTEDNLLNVSDDLGHLEKVTSGQAVLATTSVILKELRRRQRPMAMTSQKTEKTAASAIFTNWRRQQRQPSLQTGEDGSVSQLYKLEKTEASAMFTNWRRRQRRPFLQSGKGDSVGHL